METKEIAKILRERDAEKYSAIIERAENNGYHDFKFDIIPDHPEYNDCECPKWQLVCDLDEFPELVDIRNDVISGKYDESPDDEYKNRMRNDLMADGCADGIFEALGFAPPTEEERNSYKS